MKQVFLNVDLAGAEWVIVAYLCASKSMLEVVQSGESPHVCTASFMYGIERKEISREDKENDSVKDPKILAEWRNINWPDVDKKLLPEASTLRFSAKTANHSLNYGLMPPAFAMRNDIPIRDAEKTIDLYRNKAYPEIPKWHKRIQDEINEKGELINCFGRIRPFQGRITQETYQQGYAFIPQSTVFDITRNAMVSKECRNVPFIGQVHDSLLCVCPSDPSAIMDTINAIDRGLSVDLCYSGKTFKLKSDYKIGFRLNKKSMISVSLDENHIRDVLKRLSHE